MLLLDRLAAVIGVSAAAKVVAEIVPSPISGYANLGATVALSVIVIFLITKGLPSLLLSQKQERDALLARLDKRDEDRRMDNEELRQTLEKMLAHCMSAPWGRGGVNSEG